MKGLVWATAALGATATFAALGLWQRQGVVFVSPPPPRLETAQARCPDYTLEDNGVCLPLSQERVPSSGLDAKTWLAPDGVVSAFDVYWRDAPVSAAHRSRLPGDAPVLLVRTRLGASLSCPTTLTLAQVTHLDRDEAGVWVTTLTGANVKGETQSLTASGLASMAPDAKLGAPCEAGTPLGTAGDALVVYLTPTEPGSPGPSAPHSTAAPSTL